MLKVSKVLSHFFPYEQNFLPLTRKDSNSADAFRSNSHFLIILYTFKNQFMITYNRVHGITLMKNNMISVIKGLVQIPFLQNNQKAYS